MPIPWWTVDSLAKVFPDNQRPAHASSAIDLAAARGEREDAQVALAVPPGDRVKKAAFAFTDLRGPGGSRIGKQRLDAFWQWFVFVHENPRANRDHATVLRRAPGFFPDAFLEAKEFPLRAGMTQPLWVRVSVPPDAAPGGYRGRLTLSLDFESGKAERIDVPIRLEVWPFSIPASPTIRHTEWMYPTLVSDYYHIEAWSDAHWTWLERIAADMAAHRQDMILTPFSELVQVTRRDDGKFAYDLTRLDRWLDIFQAAGVTWIEGGHVAGRVGGWDSPIVLGRLRVLDARGKPVDTSREAMPDAAYEPILRGMLQRVHARLRERGLADRYVQHIADEPIPKNMDSWTKIAAKVRRWLPGVRTIDAVMAEGMEKACDIRVPQVQEVHGPSRVKPPQELWSYVCVFPQGVYPNRFLDYPSVRNRILFWLSWSLGLKGFLHWGYAYWHTWVNVPGSGTPGAVPISPWTDAAAGSHYCGDAMPLPAGDPHIVYPGKSTICSSIRWEVVRKGLEDYETLRLLEQALRRPTRRNAAAQARGQEILKLVRSTIAPSPAGHSHDAALLLTTRRQAGETISLLRPEE